VPSTRAVAKVILVAVAILGALYLLYQIRSVIKMLFIAVFLAVALGPAVNALHRGRVPRWAAILAVYFGILLSLVGIGLAVSFGILAVLAGLRGPTRTGFSQVRGLPACGSAALISCCKISMSRNGKRTR